MLVTCVLRCGRGQRDCNSISNPVVSGYLKWINSMIKINRAINRYNTRVAGGPLSWWDQLRDLPALVPSMLRDLRSPRTIFTLAFMTYVVKLVAVAAVSLVYLLVCKSEYSNVWCLQGPIQQHNVTRELPWFMTM